MLDDGKPDEDAHMRAGIARMAALSTWAVDPNCAPDEPTRLAGPTEQASDGVIELQLDDTLNQARQGVITAGGDTLIIPIGTTLESAQRSLILATLQAVNGSKSKAAAILGVSLKTLYNRLHAYGEPLDRRLRLA